MSDTQEPPETPPTPELKQSRTMGKAAARDAKRLRNNANRNLEAPDMPDLQQEVSVAERLGTRGHGAKHPILVERVLRLAEQGFSQTEICRKVKMSPRTLNEWLRTEPDFAEDFKSRYRSYIDDQARQLVPLASTWGKPSETLHTLLNQARRMYRLKGLKPSERVIALDRALQREIAASTAIVNAQDRRVHRTLQVAGRQLPQDWGEHSEGDSGVIVLDVSLGAPIKTLGLPGTPEGQNVKALEAGRWKALPAPEDVNKIVQGVQNAREDKE